MYRGGAVPVGEATMVSTIERGVITAVSSMIRMGRRIVVAVIRRSCGLAIQTPRLWL